jgi:hypothetical protein
MHRQSERPRHGLALHADQQLPAMPGRRPRQQDAGLGVVPRQDLHHRQQQSGRRQVRCTTAVNKDDFIIVAEKPARGVHRMHGGHHPPVYNCRTASISSATIQDATALSDFVADSIRKPREFRD